MRRAKIVATLGPSSNTVEKIKELILAGMNVARVNMSHGDHQTHSQTIKNIRQASEETGWEIAILLDLQGPKIRVDQLDSSITVSKGQTYFIGKKADLKGKDNAIPCSYDDLVKDCKEGERVLFDDGNIKARIIKVHQKFLEIEIHEGELLKSKKGINLPDSNISAPSFTEKDKKDLMFGLEQGVDYVALSFVRTAKDVLDVKYLLHRLKVHVPIISKIEKPEALDNIDAILEATDAVMIARGDMGVEVGNHLVPGIQKQLITKCNDLGKPVITATQMLESMIDHSTPTRAEASDVANAIWDGTDAVMLSAESASGKYPVQSVQMMVDIINQAEKTPRERPLLRNIDLSSVNASTMVAASLIAEKVDAARIVAFTSSGNSCLKIARFRPRTPVLAVTNEIDVVRRICLLWGVTPFLMKDYDEHTENLEAEMITQVRKGCNLQNGDKIVITRGDGHFFSQATSNSVRVEIIKDIPKVMSGSDTLEAFSFDGGKIMLDTHICASCQNCVSICPHNIWAVSKDTQRKTYIDTNRATECSLDMECVRVCPTGAIEIIPK